MAYKFYVVGTDRVAGMPIDNGKGSQAGGGGNPKDPWVDGFKPLKGDWDPEGFLIMQFDSEREAQAWWDANAAAQGAKYENVIMIRIQD